MTRHLRLPEPIDGSSGCRKCGLCFTDAGAAMELAVQLDLASPHFPIIPVGHPLIARCYQYPRFDQSLFEHRVAFRQ